MKELHIFYESNCFDFSEKMVMLNESKVAFLQDLFAHFTKLYQSEMEV